MTFKLSKPLIEKVLSTVDAGLSSGLGNPKPGQMCVEAAVCYALGQDHGDQPSCVSPILRLLKIALNDSNWSNNKARAKGLRRLAILQLGTNTDFDEKEFLNKLVTVTISKVVPRALRLAASIHPVLKHKQALEDAAVSCEKNKNRAASDAASYAASDAASYAASDAARAASYAARAASYAASDAASYAARAASDAASYAARAASDAARAASYAASDAARAASDAASDKELSTFAEEVVQILIEMKVPAVKYLSLTE